MELANSILAIRKAPCFPSKTAFNQTYPFFNSAIHRFIIIIRRPTIISFNSSAIRDTIDIQKNTEDALEWHSLCSSVSRFASTSMGLRAAQDGHLRIGRTQEESQKLLDQTAAAVQLPQPLDLSRIEDVSEIVSSSVSGELCSIQELCAVKRTLRCARGVFEQLLTISSDEYSKRYSPLLEILQNSDFCSELEGKIGLCIDCSLSVILDRASEKLESIRLERKKNLESLETLLKQTSTRIFQAGGIDSPLITKRRSRMCVGIRASHRSFLSGGVILDVSSSGATYFMEPKDAIELNNMEVSLSNSERAEELAILSLLTYELAQSEAGIIYLMEKIMELDLASARGAYALWIGGVCPILGEKKSESSDGIGTNKTGEFFSVDIEAIRHPLLLETSLGRRSSSFPESELTNSAKLEPVNVEVGGYYKDGTEFPLPLDIKIEDTTRVVVISGPNTGGKTATMKTLGLASLMAKAGMFLPAKNHPRLPWFDHVLADIGDHQSLEHNLSKFSGHISCLCKILEVGSSNSLVLIDEIGNGTDPSEGVALSTSILKHLAGQVKLTVVTTHYADLSFLKANDARFENAAMEFSMETLQPTYRLLWGSTGNSNALSIAKLVGFDQKVLDRAQEWVEKLMPDKQTERNSLLFRSLLEERKMLEGQARKAAMIKSESTKLYHEILAEAEDLDRRKAALKANEAQQVQRELKAARAQIDDVIKNFEMKLISASSDQVNLLVRKSEAVIASIVEAHCSRDIYSDIQTNISTSPLPKVGDDVSIKGFGNKLATVLEAPSEDGMVVVQYGKIKVRVKENDIKVISRRKSNTVSDSISPVRQKGDARYSKAKHEEAIKEEEVSFGPAIRTSKNTVDLRGMRVEEASRHLSFAISASRSYGVLFIVHGMGGGVVKELVLEMLRNHPRVAKFEQESPTNFGCTIAYIK